MQYNLIYHPHLGPTFPGEYLADYNLHSLLDDVYAICQALKITKFSILAHRTFHIERTRMNFVNTSGSVIIAKVQIPSEDENFA